MKITADHEGCIGAGLCVMAAPDVFDQDPADGRVIVRNDSPDEDQRESVEEAAGLCPVAALVLSD